MSSFQPASSQPAPRPGDPKPEVAGTASPIDEASAGWYIDPDNTNRERYWDGSAWTAEDRWRRSSTKFKRSAAAVPSPATSGRFEPVPVRATADPQDGLAIAASLLYLLAALCAIGAVVAGALLIAHKVCGPNPYDPSLTACGLDDRHPFVAAGWGVIAGGLVQAVLLTIVARLCQVVGSLRSQSAPTTSEKAAS